MNPFFKQALKSVALGMVGYEVHDMTHDNNNAVVKYETKPQYIQVSSTDNTEILYAIIGLLVLFFIIVAIKLFRFKRPVITNQSV